MCTYGLGGGVVLGGDGGPPVVKKNQENNIVNRTKAVQLIQGRIEPNSWSEV